MEWNEFNHSPECSLKKIPIIIASCGCGHIWESYKKLEEESKELKVIALDNLYCSVVMNDIGIYPQSVKGGKKPYKKTTEFMEGHNKCAMSLTNKAVVISQYVSKHKYKEDIENALLKEYIDASINEDEVEFDVNCNDVFYWACSDAEEIKPEEIKDLMDCYKESEIYGDMLWCCRKRKMRPQKPWFKSFSKEEIILFNQCGPERDE